MHKVMMRKAIGLRPPRIHQLQSGTIIQVKPFRRKTDASENPGGYYIVISDTKWPLVNLSDGSQIHYSVCDELKWELVPPDSEIVIRIADKKFKFKMKNVLTKNKLPTEVPTAALAARPTASSV